MLSPNATKWDGDGAVVRALASHSPMWPGFDSRIRRHMLVEFVVSSHSCSESFSPGTPVFPPSSKTKISKFQFDLESEGHRFVSHTRLLSVTLAKQTNKNDVA